MIDIYLCAMTKALCAQYLQAFQNDPQLCMEGQPYEAYAYTDEKANAYWYRQQDLNRIHLAVMLGSKPIGEIILKDVDHKKKECTMSIHMQNDSVKNRGYGTQAELQALEIAFIKLGMETVLVNALIKNTRSRHVLEKVGFSETHRDTIFCYYRCDRSSWEDPKLHGST